METFMTYLNNPAVLGVLYSAGGYALVKLIWPFLEKLVKKTETKSDDEFLTAIEQIVDNALARKKAKLGKRTEG